MQCPEFSNTPAVFISGTTSTEVNKGTLLSEYIYEYVCIRMHYDIIMIMIIDVHVCMSILRLQTIYQLKFFSEYSSELELNTWFVQFTKTELYP